MPSSVEERYFTRNVNKAKSADGGEQSTIKVDYFHLPHHPKALPPALYLAYHISCLLKNTRRYSEQTPHESIVPLLPFGSSKRRIYNALSVSNFHSKKILSTGACRIMAERLSITNVKREGRRRLSNKKIKNKKEGNLPWATPQNSSRFLQVLFA